MLKVSFLLWWKFKTPSKYLVNIVRTLMLMTNITCELFSLLCFLKEKEDEATTCPPARRGQLWTSYPDHTHHTHHAHHSYYTWSTTRGTNRYFHLNIIICRQFFFRWSTYDLLSLQTDLQVVPNLKEVNPCPLLRKGNN